MHIKLGYRSCVPWVLNNRAAQYYWYITDTSNASVVGSISFCLDFSDVALFEFCSDGLLIFF